MKFSINEIVHLFCNLVLILEYDIFLRGYDEISPNTYFEIVISIVTKNYFKEVASDGLFRKTHYTRAAAYYLNLQSKYRNINISRVKLFDNLFIFTISIPDIWIREFGNMFVLHVLYIKEKLECRQTMVHFEL